MACTSYCVLIFSIIVVSLGRNSYNIRKGRTKPIVIWPGMGDQGNSTGITNFANDLKKLVDGVYVLPLVIGETPDEAVTNSYTLPANEHVEFARKIIESDPLLQNGFNIIAFSQGSQFARAYVQKYPYPSVRTLVSFGGQHQGVNGIGNCGSMEFICAILRSLSKSIVYTSYVQNHITQSNFWHDPLSEDNYKKQCIFLPNINQENVIDESQKENLKMLTYLVLVKFTNDSVVIPAESSHFGYYEPGSDTKILSLFDSKLYIEDRLGLKDMYQSGSLVFIDAPGDHLQFTFDWFKINILKYLI